MRSPRACAWPRRRECLRHTINVYLNTWGKAYSCWRKHFRVSQPERMLRSRKASIMLVYFPSADACMPPAKRESMKNGSTRAQEAVEMKIATTLNDLSRHSLVAQHILSRLCPAVGVAFSGRRRRRRDARDGKADSPNKS